MIVIHYDVLIASDSAGGCPSGCNIISYFWNVSLFLGAFPFFLTQPPFLPPVIPHMILCIFLLRTMCGYELGGVRKAVLSISSLWVGHVVWLHARSTEVHFCACEFRGYCLRLPWGWQSLSVSTFWDPSLALPDGPWLGFPPFGK